MMRQYDGINGTPYISTLADRVFPERCRISAGENELLEFGASDRQVAHMELGDTWLAECKETFVTFIYLTWNQLKQTFKNIT